MRQLREQLGYTQKEFATRYQIPFRSLQNWETALRIPPDYLQNLLAEHVRRDLINRRTFRLPIYDPHKIDLPRRRDFQSGIAWLQAVQAELGQSVVFALDQALLCSGHFLGRMDEYLIWLYGDATLTRYNGVVLLGTAIQERDVLETQGLRYTSFQRTLFDALANADILDEQGMIEALSRYYFTHNESFAELFVPPEYIERFVEWAEAAVHYYDS